MKALSRLSCRWHTLQRKWSTLMAGTEAPTPTPSVNGSVDRSESPVDASSPGVESTPPSPDPVLERLRIGLERRKAWLDFWKYVIVSGFVAIAITAIPPVFQYANQQLEFAKADAQQAAELKTKEAERVAKQEEFRQRYVQEFLDKAVDQDIELRLRFAEYFASVSAEPFRDGWKDYRDRLENERRRARNDINIMEREWVARSSELNKRQEDIDELVRRLDWAYKEVGYVPRNRSVSPNPRPEIVLPPREIPVPTRRPRPAPESVAERLPPPLTDMGKATKDHCIEADNPNFLQEIKTERMHFQPLPFDVGSKDQPFRAPATEPISMNRHFWDRFDRDLRDLSLDFPGLAAALSIKDVKICVQISDNKLLLESYGLAVDISLNISKRAGIVNFVTPPVSELRKLDTEDDREWYIRALLTYLSNRSWTWEVRDSSKLSGVFGAVFSLLSDNVALRVYPSASLFAEVLKLN
jgi:hypothetical protein